MVDGDVVHKRVIAARQMQPLVVSSAVAAHLVPAPSAVSQEIYLNILFALRGVQSAPLGRLQADQHTPAGCCM